MSRKIFHVLKARALKKIGILRSEEGNDSKNEA